MAGRVALPDTSPSGFILPSISQSENDPSGEMQRVLAPAAGVRQVRFEIVNLHDGVLTLVEVYLHS